jgi:hypothetical protein
LNNGPRYEDKVFDKSNGMMQFLLLVQVGVVAFAQYTVQSTNAACDIHPTGAFANIMTIFFSSASTALVTARNRRDDQLQADYEAALEEQRRQQELENND